MRIDQMTEEQREKALFFAECNKVLREKTFDQEINEQAYKIAHSLTVGGRGEICNYCMYCDKLQQKCLANRTQRVKQKLCWRANNIYLLKKENMYGQKRNNKIGID